MHKSLTCIVHLLSLLLFNLWSQGNPPLQCMSPGVNPPLSLVPGQDLPSFGYSTHRPGSAPGWSGWLLRSAPAPGTPAARPSPPAPRTCLPQMAPLCSAHPLSEALPRRENRGVGRGEDAVTVLQTQRQKTEDWSRERERTLVDSGREDRTQGRSESSLMR